MLKVVFLYTLFFIDLEGDLTNPIPFLPYNGLTDFFTALFAFPVVLAEIDFFMLGFLMPIFIKIPPCTSLLSQLHNTSLHIRNSNFICNKKRHPADKLGAFYLSSYSTKRLFTGFK